MGSELAECPRGTTSEQLAGALARPAWLGNVEEHPRVGLPFESNAGLFSLAKMVKRFFGDEFFGFAADLMRWQAVIQQMPRDALVDPLISGVIVEGLDKIVDRSKLADLQFSAALGTRIINELRGGRITIGSLQDRFASLGERISDELHSQYFLLVDRGDAAAFTGGHSPDDLEFLAVFPDAVFDFDEAVKCQALGRATACVMHCMRVIEVGLVALCQKLGVDVVRYRNWGELLREMAKAIAAMDRTQRTPFHEAQIHLAAIKDAWRNETMHAARQYNSAESATILGVTRTFMRHLGELNWT